MPGTMLGSGKFDMKPEKLDPQGLTTSWTSSRGTPSNIFTGYVFLQNLEK